MTTPRRIRLDLATPPEVAIRAAHAAVEAMSADVRLTNAGLLIGQALDLVSAYVDEQMRDVSIDDSGNSPRRVTALAEEWGRVLRHKGHVYNEDIAKPCADPGCCTP